VRLQVKYPDGQPHEVELLGRVSIIGRDPSCDLVVHDVKCSRRHAVLETGPDGVTVRDSGSANGVFVNGQRIERAILRPGDVLSMGEVQISLIPENAAGGNDATLITPPGPAGFPTALPGSVPSPVGAPLGAPPLPPPAPAPMAPPRAAVPPPPQHTTRPAPPPPPPRPPMPGPPVTAELPRPTGSYKLSGSTDSGKVKVEQIEEEMDASARATVSGQRPLTVTVLAALWMASVLLYLANAVFSVVGTGGLIGIIAAVFSGFMAMVSGVMALGLWKVKPWARIAQIVIAGLGVLTCAFTLPSVATIVYFFRPAVKARFATGEGPGDPKEGLFMGLILGTVVLGVLLGVGLSFLGALGTAGARVP
jgi:pSer/pThr/pTyr-binding forkhead associated (FHA) protein